MGFTLSDLENIRRAIALGEKSVQFADRTVVYRSLAELLQAEQRIAKALGVAKASTFLGFSTKGL